MAKLTQKQRKKTVKVELNISDELNDLALVCRSLWKRLPQSEAAMLYEYLQQQRAVKPTAAIFKNLVANIGFLYVMAVDEAIEQHKRMAVEREAVP